MSSPQTSSGLSEQPRDSYGFEVKKEYQKLHTKYAPLWEKEEQERVQLWTDFLASFQGGDVSESNGDLLDAEAALEAALLQLENSEVDREDLSWWRQLRTLVQAGIPMASFLCPTKLLRRAYYQRALRGRLWRTFLQAGAERDEGGYASLVSQALAPHQQDSRKLSEGQADALTSSLAGTEASERLHGSQATPPSSDAGHSIADRPPLYKGKAQDWTGQIEKDLHRTFPGHPVMDRTGRRSLRRILAAYACRNPSVGYCQGMNFVAGCLLLFMEEEDAFWCLTVIVEKLLLGYFSTTMVAPQVDQLVFKALVDQQFPRLTSHLEALGVNVASVSTQWFLCVFVNSLPLETCLRVWDIFVFERCSSLLFRVALALVDIYAQALIATVDSVDAFSLLQNMAPLSFDSSRLVDVACIAYSHVNHGHMEGLRRGFEDSVKAQVQERLERTKKREEAELASENGNGVGPGACHVDSAAADFAKFLPRIQVASARSPAEPARFSYEWRGENAPLHLDSSKAAATAYKIASSPAAASDHGHSGGTRATEASALGVEDGLDWAFQEPAAQSEPGSSARLSRESRREQKPAETAQELDDQLHDVLDKRKHSLLESAAMPDDERRGVVAQLMSLVGRLEEEMFLAEARKFEAENKAARLVEEAAELRTAIQRTAEAAVARRASLAPLRVRHAGEADAVAAGGRRCLAASASLRSVEAKRALRASLLKEKEELIAGLQQELGQGTARSRGSLFQKLGLTGRSRS